ncbi:MAG: DNA gyrase inhibitor YacG [Deltaproteobacteria bacterium]|nr:MAG: DNA gyrase inhibitor YacG [Deltaproteobacteria bacterium]
MDLKSTIHCRQCGKKIDLDPNPYRPFCSDRCRKIDLGKWFGESYRVPDKEIPSENFQENNLDDEEREE